MRIILVFVLIMAVQGISAQKNFAVSYTAGLHGYDVIGNKKDIKNKVSGWGVQNEIALWYFIKQSKLDWQFGIGFNRFEYLDNEHYTIPIFYEHPQRNGLTSSYVTFKSGINYSFDSWKKTQLIANLNHYFLAHKYIINISEKRYFLNFEMGVSRRVGKRGEIILTSPISITPIYAQDVNYLVPGTNEFVEFRSFVEMTGINIGYRYRL